MNITVAFSVNGQQREVRTDADRSLLDILREDLHLTGTKYGCGKAQCGTCTVLVGGKAVRSCMHKAADLEGAEILTIEGLAKGDALHPVQEAFLAEGALQCGYCTAGMIMRTVALLREDPDPSDENIVSALNRNICRCNGYTRILQAVRRAARRQPAGDAL